MYEAVSDLPDFRMTLPRNYSEAIQTERGYITQGK